MIHYSCDRCKRMIDTEQEVRHIVKIEVQSVVEPLVDDDGLDENEDDRDHLLEIHEMLEAMDPEDIEEGLEADERTLSFDLCSECYRKFIRNPLGIETTVRVGFSHN